MAIFNSYVTLPEGKLKIAMIKFLMPVVLPFITESLPSWPSAPEFHHSWVLSPCFISLFQTHLSLQNKIQNLGSVNILQEWSNPIPPRPKRVKSNQQALWAFPHLFFELKTQLQLWFKIQFPSSNWVSHGLGDIRSLDLCSVGARHPTEAQGRIMALAVDVSGGDLHRGWGVGGIVEKSQMFQLKMDLYGLYSYFSKATRRRKHQCCSINGKRCCVCVRGWHQVPLFACVARCCLHVKKHESGVSENGVYPPMWPIQ